MKGSVAKVTLRNTKLSRALSLSCMFAFRHISDIPEDSPAIAMLKECGTVLPYKQQKSDDARACERMFNLPAGSAADISSLTNGTSMMRIGSKDPFIAIHVRSALEIELTDTDKAMKSTATLIMWTRAGRQRLCYKSCSPERAHRLQKATGPASIREHWGRKTLAKDFWLWSG